jgi:hypothetical protein
MVQLNSCTLPIITGNGLSVSEDLARRFIEIDLDPRTENPEARLFHGDIRAEVTKRREELLAAVLTIWRWGRLDEIAAGQTLGSFEQWGRWVRDPLLSLGCKDPVARIAEAKERDTHRQSITTMFQAWWENHGSKPVRANDLHPLVVSELDPQGRGLQYRVSRLTKLDGTRQAGYALSRQVGDGPWSVATYALRRVNEGAPPDDRTPRAMSIPVTPVPPVPSGSAVSPLVPVPPTTPVPSGSAVKPATPVPPVPSGWQEDL